MIKGIWSFKRKRIPSGDGTKHGARICAHEGMRKWGESYYEIHSPVVDWSIVRFLMTMDIALDLETKSIDFMMAHHQAVPNADMFIEIPWGH